MEGEEGGARGTEEKGWRDAGRKVKGEERRETRSHDRAHGCPSSVRKITRQDGRERREMMQ